MQQISEVLKNQNLMNSGQSLQQTSSGEPSTSIFTQVRPERVTKLFLQIAAIYPYRWMGQFADKAAMKVAREEWLEALKEMHEYDIRRGLDAVRSKGGEFPPSIPEFVKMCTPTIEEFGILADEIAYQAFCNKDFSNLLVSKTEIALRPRAFDMSQMWIKEHKKTFLYQYDIFVKDHIKSEVTRKYSKILLQESNAKRLTAK